MQRLVLLDGHAILHRAYHALPPLTSSKGEPTNAVYGFALILLRVLSDLQPSHLIVAFDTPAPTFRNKIFKEYQAQRPKIDQELVTQIDLTHKMVNEMKIPIYELDGYEADDILGTIAFQAKPRKFKTQNSKLKIQEVIIVTGDRDMLQLVSECTKLYMPIKGLSESKLFDIKDVVEKYGIEPEQIVDYKALIGDPSDNYPGVAGIGPKTASGLLNKFGSLDGIYNNLDGVVSGSVREKLKKGKESAYLSKKLAQIIIDAPIKLNIDACTRPKLDGPDILSFFDELGFRSLIPRLMSNNKQQTTDNKKRESKKKNKAEQTSLF